jgi:hypothetical protein
MALTPSAVIWTDQRDLVSKRAMFQHFDKQGHAVGVRVDLNLETVHPWGTATFDARHLVAGAHQGGIGVRLVEADGRISHSFEVPGVLTSLTAPIPALVRVGDRALLVFGDATQIRATWVDGASGTAPPDFVVARVKSWGIRAAPDKAGVRIAWLDGANMGAGSALVSTDGSVGEIASVARHGTPLALAPTALGSRVVFFRALEAGFGKTVLLEGQTEDYLLETVDDARYDVSSVVVAKTNALLAATRSGVRLTWLDERGGVHAPPVAVPGVDNSTELAFAAQGDELLVAWEAGHVPQMSIALMRAVCR